MQSRLALTCDAAKRISSWSACLAINGHGWRLTAYSTIRLLRLLAPGERSHLAPLSRPSTGLWQVNVVGRSPVWPMPAPDAAEARGRIRHLTSRSGDGNHARYQPAGVCMRADREVEDRQLLRCGQGQLPGVEDQSLACNSQAPKTFVGRPGASLPRLLFRDKPKDAEQRARVADARLATLADPTNPQCSLVTSTSVLCLYELQLRVPSCASRLVGAHRWSLSPGAF